jgi:hypothetical protein
MFESSLHFKSHGRPDPVFRTMVRKGHGERVFGTVLNRGNSHAKSPHFMRALEGRFSAPTRRRPRRFIPSFLRTSMAVGTRRSVSPGRRTKQYRCAIASASADY